LPVDHSPTPYNLLRATASDLDAIEEIERLSFPAPWPRAAFADELDRPWARLEVLREAATGRTLGFCNYWLVADELHILNVAVHPDARRRGHAARLLEHMLAAGREAHARVASLEVRVSNQAATALYRKRGFREVGLRPKYYANDGEDALLMDLDLEAAP
jgi:[ribosomal protein S18]-alanine N-acetyltransferase